MFRTLPSSSTLLAFEAAARLGSFQQAAAALHLTPSAISHRIKQLETTLGKPLFERQHRHIVLTADGQRYYTAIHETFQRLNDITEQIRTFPHKRLRLSVAPALGSKWLLSRLSAFQETHPDIEFELSTGTALAPLFNGDADLGLRYGKEDWPGLEAWKLFDETLITVCSPAYSTRLPDLPNPTALNKARLLRHPLLPWHTWFAAANLTPIEPIGPHFEDALLMLEAAAAGQGVALMTATLAAPYLASGALIQPVPLCCPADGFYAIAPPSIQEKPWVTEFIRWLIRSAR